MYSERPFTRSDMAAEPTLFNKTGLIGPYPGFTWSLVSPSEHIAPGFPPGKRSGFASLFHEWNEP